MKTNEKGLTLYNHDNTNLIFVIFAASGRTATLHDEGVSPARVDSSGSIQLFNDRAFGYQRRADRPFELTINGQVFYLNQGRVFAAKDDGTAKQLALFPPLATAKDPAAMAQLVADGTLPRSAPPPPQSSVMSNLPTGMAASPITVRSAGPSWFRLLLMGAAILGVAAALLVFGIIRWKTGLGKAALIVAVLLPFVGLPGGLLLYRAARVSALRAEAEALQQQAAYNARARQLGVPMPEHELVKRATATIQDLADGKTASVMARFAPSLRNRWPEDKVQQWWPSVTAGQNKFLRVAGTSLVEAGHWNTRYVTVPCEFESSRCGIRISFFPDGDIEGIKLLPQGTDAQPVNPPPPIAIWETKK